MFVNSFNVQADHDLCLKSLMMVILIGYLAAWLKSIYTVNGVAMDVAV